MWATRHEKILRKNRVLNKTLAQSSSFADGESTSEPGKHLSPSDRIVVQARPRGKEFVRNTSSPPCCEGVARAASAK